MVNTSSCIGWCFCLNSENGARIRRNFKTELTGFAHKSSTIRGKMMPQTNSHVVGNFRIHKGKTERYPVLFITTVILNILPQKTDSEKAWVPSLLIGYGYPTPFSGLSSVGPPWQTYDSVDHPFTAIRILASTILPCSAWSVTLNGFRSISAISGQSSDSCESR